MNEEQQTNHIGDTNKMVAAVEWLELVYHSQQEYLSERDFKEAKAMEKEHIAKAFNEGMLNSVDYFGNDVDEAEQYYKENYKSN
jgi:hypothetical protein